MLIFMTMPQGFVRDDSVGMEWSGDLWLLTQQLEKGDVL
jgi:hypothetical protein